MVANWDLFEAFIVIFAELKKEEENKEEEKPDV